MEPLERLTGPFQNRVLFLTSETRTPIFRTLSEKMQRSCGSWFRFAQGLGGRGCDGPALCPQPAQCTRQTRQPWTASPECL